MTRKKEWSRDLGGLEGFFGDENDSCPQVLVSFSQNNSYFTGHNLLSKTGYAP